MKNFKFSVDIYNTAVYLFQFEQGDNYTDIPENIWENLDDETQEGIQGWFDINTTDSGYTVHDPQHCSIYVIFSIATSTRNKANTYYHEVRHVTDDIMSYKCIEDNEAAAYLQGYLGEYFNDFMFRK